jgi:hypothetical protein
MVVGDIAPDKYMNFEDWWVHPDLADQEMICKVWNNLEGAKKADEFMLNSN